LRSEGKKAAAVNKRNEPKRYKSQSDSFEQQISRSEKIFTEISAFTWSGQFYSRVMLPKRRGKKNG
jgi:hypothetical protein